MLDLCMFADATHNQEELSVVGAEGKIEALVPENVVRIGRRGIHSIGEVETEAVRDDRIAYKGYHDGSSYIEHLNFRDAILSGGSSEVTVGDGLLAVAIGVAAHRSIDEGRPVMLEELLRS